MIPPPRALVLSPSASHPQDYGNRNRVWQVTNFIKELGYRVDFLLYPFEPDWAEGIPPEAEDMRLAWDAFWVVPPTIPLHTRAAGDYHVIDEWWDDGIGQFLSWLFARRHYDLFIVNYTFLSKALTFAPKTTIRVLETHDLFSGRKEMLAALRVAPEFFYTTPDQEKIAFERADIVVAIKESEAAQIQIMTETDVVCLPFFPSSVRKDAATRSSFAGLSIGFIGAFNSVNIANFQAFLNRFEPLLRIYCPPLRLVVAGNVCRGLQCDNPAIEFVGRVDDIAAFYAEVDVIVAPLAHSTGIKIKVGEALGWGKGVVSTLNGFDGFPATDPMHALPDVGAVCRALIQLAFDRDRRDELIARSRMSASLAQQSTALAFRGLAAAIGQRKRRIVFIVDEAFWAAAGFRAARLGQWTQLCGFLAPVIICYLADERVCDRRSFHDRADLVQIDVSGIADLAQVAELAARLDELLHSIGRTEVTVSLRQPWAEALCAELAARGHRPIADLWCPPLAAASARFAVPATADLWAPDVSADGRFSAGEGIEAMPLRFAPAGFDDWVHRPIGDDVIALISVDAEEARSVDEELALVLSARGLPLSRVTAIGDPAEAAEALFARLRQGKRPMLLLTVAGAPRLQQACRALAAIGGFPYLDIPLRGYPVALQDREGQMRLHYSCVDLVESALALIGAGVVLGLSRHARDGGWSRLWKLLEARLHRSEDVAGAIPERHEKRTAGPAAVAAVEAVA